ncbi:MAG: hypothetical protein CM15mP40_13790 [Alphaproteobacteria bacterium]|nr:MAG: hypothetical protein CM15mP40_13790 [Alphaproteobacteria bacterium]
MGPNQEWDQSKRANKLNQGEKLGKTKMGPKPWGLKNQQVSQKKRGKTMGTKNLLEKLPTQNRETPPMKWARKGETLRLTQNMGPTIKPGFGEPMEW